MVGDFMAELIGSWGLEALLMRDPVAAAAWLADTTPLDLLITDQTMPGLTGIELAHAPARPGRPAVFYTGDADISMLPTRSASAGARLIEADAWIGCGAILLAGKPNKVMQGLLPGSRQCGRSPVCGDRRRKRATGSRPASARC